MKASIKCLAIAVDKKMKPTRKVVSKMLSLGKNPRTFMITVELYEADFYSLFSRKQVDYILPSVCSVVYNELNTTRSVFGRCL